MHTAWNGTLLLLNADASLPHAVERYRAHLRLFLAYRQSPSLHLLSDVFMIAIVHKGVPCHTSMPGGS